MKLEVGDVVSYIDPTGLCNSFTEAHGLGPWIIHSYARSNGIVYCMSMQEHPLLMDTRGPVNKDNWWTHDVDDLQLHVFLTEARKAVKAKETNAKAKAKNRANKKAKPAARRGRAA